MRLCPAYLCGPAQQGCLISPLFTHIQEVLRTFTLIMRITKSVLLCSRESVPSRTRGHRFGILENVAFLASDSFTNGSLLICTQAAPPRRAQHKPGFGSGCLLMREKPVYFSFLLLRKFHGAKSRVKARNGENEDVSHVGLEPVAPGNKRGKNCRTKEGIVLKPLHVMGRSQVPPTTKERGHETLEKCRDRDIAGYASTGCRQAQKRRLDNIGCGWGGSNWITK